MRRTNRKRETKALTLRCLAKFKGRKMMKSKGYSLQKFIRQERGAMAVEFAILIPAFLLVVFGIADFGHAWYMEHLMTNASREGARYGIRYNTDALNNRLLPQNLTPSVADYIEQTSAENGGQGGWGLAQLLPGDAASVVNLSGPAFTETNPSVLAGKDLVVTVTAKKYWFVLGNLIPGLGTYRQLQVVTTMKCE
jgi:hypothetical protein